MDSGGIMHLRYGKNNGNPYWENFINLQITSLVHIAVGLSPNVNYIEGGYIIVIRAPNTVYVEMPTSRVIGDGCHQYAWQ